MASTDTVPVPHLGGSRIGLQRSGEGGGGRPTLVMVNSFTASAEQYRPQFADERLTAVADLVALEPFGHGATRAGWAQFTYWDSAIANLQALDELGIDEAFVLGTSQGGWIAARMAILAPDRIRGIVPLGTSMDFESPESRERGCWNGVEFCTPAIGALAEPVGEDWVIPLDLVDAVLVEGLGEQVPDDERTFWHGQHQGNYTGDDGRHRLRQATINLRDRDGLHGRLDGVRCPVLWMHGTDDRVYSVANAEDGIARFTSSADASLQVVDGGAHFLSASHADAVNPATAEFISRWG